MQTCSDRMVIPSWHRRSTSASLVRVTAAAEHCPFAGPGWLLAMAKTKPASRSARRPGRTPSRKRILARVERDADEARLLVADDVDEGPVAIEDGEPGPRGGAYFTDSHFVFSRCSRGWLTSRCHTTAAKPSVCGVVRSADTVGMTTHASATCLV